MVPFATSYVSTYDDIRVLSSHGDIRRLSSHGDMLRSSSYGDSLDVSPYVYTFQQSSNRRKRCPDRSPPSATWPPPYAGDVRPWG